MIGATFSSLLPLTVALGFSIANLVLEEAGFLYFLFLFLFLIFYSVSLMVGFDFSEMVVVLGFFVFVGCWVFLMFLNH